MAMSEPSVCLAKAEESLVGAASELAHGRYNNSVNRAYYACFQAAIAVLSQVFIHVPLRYDLRLLSTVNSEGERGWRSASREPISPRTSFSWGCGGTWPIP